MLLCVYFVLSCVQFFDSVVWMSVRASGLLHTSSLRIFMRKNLHTFLTASVVIFCDKNAVFKLFLQICVEGNIASGKSHYLDCFKNNSARKVSERCLEFDLFFLHFSPIWRFEVRGLVQLARASQSGFRSAVGMERLPLEKQGPNFRSFLGKS